MMKISYREDESMASTIDKFLTSSAIATAVLCLGVPAFAQGTAQIDTELATGIDFREVAFAGCLDSTECTVGNVTIIGQRVNQDGAWLSASLYWDPIDGIGVQDGAQNDEIDFDERVLVRFDGATTLERIWLSDLFMNEDRRYGSSQTDLIIGEPEDAEVAGVSFFAAGAELLTITVSGESPLPWAQFNQEVDIRFREDGDLRRRIVVNDELLTIVVPGNNITLQTPLGANDDEKQSLFEGLETVELDLTELLAEFNTAALFEVGTKNFELISAIAQDPDNLAEIMRIAQDKRTSIQMSNGEVGFNVDPSMTVEEIAFFSPFDASNDFSIAGIVLGK